MIKWSDREFLCSKSYI